MKGKWKVFCNPMCGESKRYISCFFTVCLCSCMDDRCFKSKINRVIFVIHFFICKIFDLKTNAIDVIPLC